jgi:hypothetical protein
MFLSFCPLSYGFTDQNLMIPSLSSSKFLFSSRDFGVSNSDSFSLPMLKRENSLLTVSTHSKNIPFVNVDLAQAPPKPPFEGKRVEDAKVVQKFPARTDANAFALRLLKKHTPRSNYINTVMVIEKTSRDKISYTVAGVFGVEVLKPLMSNKTPLFDIVSGSLYNYGEKEPLIPQAYKFIADSDGVLEIPSVAYYMSIDPKVPMTPKKVADFQSTMKKEGAEEKYAASLKGSIVKIDYFPEG